MNDRMKNFSEQTLKVLTYSQEEVQRLNGTLLGTEHFLLGLLREGESLAAQVLFKSGLSLDKARSVAEEFTVRLGKVPYKGLSSDAGRVINQAGEEATKFNQSVSPQHLLLAIVQQQADREVELLKRLNLSSQEIIQQLRQSF